MSLASLVLGRRGESGFGYASTAEEVTSGLDLSGKRILVTGVNSGIGLESARVLAMRGATVLGAARTIEKAQAALAGLPNDPVPLECELSEPASVRACVAAVRALGAPVDAILCNAGIMMIPKRTVKHGQELQLLTNHFGHFILVTELLDVLAGDGRVVMVSSEAHRGTVAGGIALDDLSLEKGYDRISAYGQSKLANLLFARSLAKRFEGSGRAAFALHPGVIASKLWRHTPGLSTVMAIGQLVATKSVAEGAATQCWAAVHPDAGARSGAYLKDSNVATPSSHARDDELAERLWRATEAIVAEL